MQTARYYLEMPDSRKHLIHKIGKTPTTFAKNGSGVWNHRQRTDFVRSNPGTESHLFIIPPGNLKRSDSQYAPATKRFEGYFQFPRTANFNPEIPSYLKLSTPVASRQKVKTELTTAKTTRSNLFMGVDSTAGEPASLPYLESSLVSMIQSKMSARKSRNCYHRRCRDPQSPEAVYQGLIDRVKTLKSSEDVTLDLKTCESTNKKTTEGSVGFQ